MREDIKQPIPQGKYISAVRHKDVIYTSGMTPRKSGKLVYFGKIKANDDLVPYKNAVRLATLNALIAAQNCLMAGEKISLILQLNVFLNAEVGFMEHAKIADFASDMIIETLGESCIGTRAAIGVASLPGNSPVEITLTAMVDSVY